MSNLTLAGSRTVAEHAATLTELLNEVNSSPRRGAGAMAEAVVDCYDLPMIAVDPIAAWIRAVDPAGRGDVSMIARNLASRLFG